MSLLSCPHCGASNEDGAAFCAACGKALPLASTGGPRVVTAASMPTTAAGTQMLSEQLVKHTKRAAKTLLVVGIVQAIVGCTVVMLLSQQRGFNQAALPLLIGIQVALGALFVGLSFWARRSPLPASIVGLVLYGTLVTINVVTTLSQLKDAPAGTRGGGVGGIGIGWLDIVILVFLARGIQAALEHRKLLENRID